MAKFSPPIESYEEWVLILSRTLQGNNWRHLHYRLQTDLSYTRKLKDTLDYFFKTPVAQNEEIKWLKVWDSIQRNPKIWKSFCEHFSVMMCENGTASIDDMQTVLNIFHRGVEFKFYDQSPNSIDLRTLNIVQKAMKIWENKWKESGNNSVRCNIADAFGVMRKKVNPYEVPYWATNIMSNIIDKNLSQNDAVDEECKRQNSSKREPIHDDSWMKDEFRKRYKWSALNDYLFERVENNREHLTISEVERVYSIFDKISLPTTLKVTPDFIHYGIGKLTVSETEVIKSNRH